jgi:glyoxylase-like metal-dependent hydrolase (beta-lactamase superfamily II)
MKIKKVVVGLLQTNCYLVISDKELLVIDPGDEIEKILLEIKKNKARPKYIVLTHYHFDHVSGARELKEKTLAKILYHERERAFFADLPADQYLKEGDRIKIGQEFLEVVHSPGHTTGSICLLGKNEIFSGDLIFEEGYGRTDLPGGSEEDLKKSLKKLAKILKKGMTIYPGHGNEFKK